MKKLVDPSEVENTMKIKTEVKISSKRSKQKATGKKPATELTHKQNGTSQKVLKLRMHFCLY